MLKRAPIFKSGQVELGARTSIGAFSSIGVTYRRGGGPSNPKSTPTRVGRGCQIGSNVTIMRGTRIGDNTSIDPGTVIEEGVEIGRNCILTYHAFVCNEARIRDECVVGGFVGEHSEVGRGCRMFGNLVHRQSDPASDWDSTVEPAPVLEDHVFVGFGAVIVGKVRVGKQSFIAAGAMVLKDVPSGNIVVGLGRATHHSRSKMELAKSTFFDGV